MFKTKVLMSLGLLQYSWVFILSYASAQPVIEEFEFPRGINLQQRYYEGGPYDFGFSLPGSPPWNFGAGPEDTTIDLYINKANAFFANHFPSADFAEQIFPKGNGYYFLTISPMVLLSYGFSYIGDTGDTILVVLNNPVRVLQFPLKVNSAWSDTASATINNLSTLMVYRDSRVISWGDLTVPAFSNLSSLVLRVREIVEYPTSQDTFWTYGWIVENWGFSATASLKTSDTTHSLVHGFARLLDMQMITGGLQGRKGFESKYGSSIHIQPNPMRNFVEIYFALSEKGIANLKIYDLSGRLVQTLMQGEGIPGAYTLSWDGRDSRGRKSPAGLYFTRLSQGTSNETRKIILLR